MHQAAIVSPSEWVIMELLWERPRTLMELVKELHEPIGWTKSTVATMVRRMTEKGSIHYTEHGRTKLFIPTVSRESVSLLETKCLLKRAFHGRISLLVDALAQDQALSAADIDEIMQVLKTAK